MELKIKSKITANELFDFLLHHTYSSVWGFTGVLISICALFALLQLCVTGGDILSVACTFATVVLFLVIQPVRLFIQSRRLIESDRGYQEPIEYTFGSSGISLCQNEDSAAYRWDEITKVTATKKIVAIYIGKQKVFKLAKRDIGDDYDTLKQMVRTHAIHAVVKLR